MRPGTVPRDYRGQRSGNWSRLGEGLALIWLSLLSQTNAGVPGVPGRVGTVLQASDEHVQRRGAGHSWGRRFPQLPAEEGDTSWSHAKGDTKGWGVWTVSEARGEPPKVLSRIRHDRIFLLKACLSGVASSERGDPCHFRLSMFKIFGKYAPSPHLFKLIWQLLCDLRCT